MLYMKVMPEKADRFAAILERLGANEVLNKEELAKVLEHVCEPSDIADLAVEAEGYRFKPLLKTAWAHCVSPLLDNDDPWRLSAWKDDGGFRKALKILAIWKIPVEEHRSFGYGPVEVLSDDLLRDVADWEQNQIDPGRKQLFKAWRDGREKILECCVRSNWDLQSDKLESSECSVQDLAHCVFVLSHIGWERKKLVQAVPRAALERILSLKMDVVPYWTDPVTVGENPKGASVIATAMAVTALADWSLSAREGMRGTDLADTVRQEIESQESVLKKANEVCTQGLRWLVETWTQNGWPCYVEKGNDADTKATSLAFSVLERFSDEYEIETPYGLPYTRLWLVNRLRDGLEQNAAYADTRTMEQVAFAMTALCRTARRTATFWLRNSVSWLLNTTDSDKKYPNEAQYREALRFYGVIELLRRKDCVHILRQLL